MRDADKWTPTKFVERRGRWRASRNPTEVFPGSRLVSDLTARFYEVVIPTYATGHLCDLGCGKAPLAGIYRGSISRSTCIDWPHSPHGMEHVDVAANLAIAIPVADAEVDCILLSDVIEHVPDPLQLLRESQRILRPGGFLLANSPFLYWVHEAPFDFTRLTEYGLRDLARRAGLEVVALEPLGGAAAVVFDLASKGAASAGPLGRIVAAWMSSLGFIATTGRFVSWFDRKTRHVLPLSYGLVLRRPD